MNNHKATRAQRVLSIGMVVGIAHTSCAHQCEWEALPSGGFTNRLFSLLAMDEYAGQGMYVGGNFTAAGEVSAKNIVRWDGRHWAAMGDGVGSPVLSLAAFDDGRGAALYVGGPFARAGDISDANGVARWDGAEWSALGAGIRNFTDPPAAHQAAAMIVFDDGSGPALYVGGQFTQAGGLPALNIARWDGAGWSALGEGLSGSVGVRALAVYDDGSGPALYAGGYFWDGAARWNGDSWSPIGGGWAVHVDAMAVFDDGTGPALYAGGQMSEGLARWDGSRWTSVGGGVNGAVRSMHIFDDGSGPALYVGGAFSAAGGEEAWGIARWDGTEWNARDVGVSGSVQAMTTFDDGAGPALYAAGKFDVAGGPSGIPVENIARWRCASACPADCDGSGDLTFFDFLCFQNLFAAMDPGADCDGDSAFTFFDFLCFQNAFVAGCP